MPVASTTRCLAPNPQGTALGAQGIDLVEEDGGGGVVPSHLEQDADQLLAVTAVPGLHCIRARSQSVMERTENTKKKSSSKIPPKQCYHKSRPSDLLAIVLALTLKKVVSHSVATAFASSVFPVPGGPNISTPFQGRRMPYARSAYGVVGGRTCVQRPQSTPKT